MIQVSNATTQTLQPGQALKFDGTNFLHTGCGECFNSQIPTSVKLNGNCGAVYEIQFEGNITATAAGTVQIALALEGQPLVQTAMNAQIATANALTNVSTGTYLKMCCGDANRVSVINTGTTAVTVAQNSSLRVCRKG